MSIFFFQAEDGIRDLTVTGVQTCALPISRYLLCCEGLQSTREHFAFSVFERTFKDYGLPRAIRSDNGVPFASTSAFFGLSKLSVWWLLRIPRDREQGFHGMVNTDSTAT